MANSVVRYNVQTQVTKLTETLTEHDHSFCGLQRWYKNLSGQIASLAAMRDHESGGCKRRFAAQINDGLSRLLDAIARRIDKLAGNPKDQVLDLVIMITCVKQMMKSVQCMSPSRNNNANNARQTNVAQTFQ